MHSQRMIVGPLALATVLLAAAIGCHSREASQAEQGSDHDHLHEHDHDIPEHRPQDYGAAVAEIRRRHAAVLEELAENGAESQQESINQMIDIARWLPEIAGDSDMPEAQWNIVNAEAQNLGRSYNALGEKLQHNPPASAESVAGVDVIVDRLQEIADDGAWNKP